MRGWLLRRAQAQARAAAQDLGFARANLPEYHLLTVEAYEPYSKALNRLHRREGRLRPARG